jgi:CRP/FNR family cyclic AMP-dependent transcriptional regulator
VLGIRRRLKVLRRMVRDGALKRDDFFFESSSRFIPLFKHDLFRKTGIHFSGSCFSQKAGSAMAIEKCINEFDVDEVIFEEGSTGRELFVVLEGKVDIAKVNGASKTVIVTLGKGEFFGEMAVIDGSSRSASAISAAPNTRVMRINHARFVYLVSQQPAFALMIMDALSKRLRASNAVTFRAAQP